MKEKFKLNPRHWGHPPNHIGRKPGVPCLLVGDGRRHDSRNHAGRISHRKRREAADATWELYEPYDVVNLGS